MVLQAVVVRVVRVLPQLLLVLRLLTAAAAAAAGITTHLALPAVRVAQVEVAQVEPQHPLLVLLAQPILAVAVEPQPWLKQQAGIKLAVLVAQAL